MYTHPGPTLHLPVPPRGCAWFGGGWFGWVRFPPPVLFLAPRGGWGVFCWGGGFGVSGPGSPNPPSFPRVPRSLQPRPKGTADLPEDPEEPWGPSCVSPVQLLSHRVLTNPRRGSHALGYTSGGLAHALGRVSGLRKRSRCVWFRISRGPRFGGVNASYALDVTLGVRPEAQCIVCIRESCHGTCHMAALLHCS